MSANALTVVSHEASQDDQHGQYLIFVVMQESFAIDILHIKEIIEYGKLTQVPMMPRSIRGVINLRGAVVPVLDLCACFHGEPARIGKRSCIVIVEVENDGEWIDVGLVVDSVTEVLELPASEIEPAPAFGTHIQMEFIAGMGKVNGRFVIMLNVDKVLAGQDMTQIGMAGLPDSETAIKTCAA